jgi:hypothetical protein
MRENNEAGAGVVLLKHHGSVDTIMRKRRNETARTMERRLTRVLIGRTPGEAIGAAWADGYAAGWRDRGREGG